MNAHLKECELVHSSVHIVTIKSPSIVRKICTIVGIKNDNGILHLNCMVAVISARVMYALIIE